MELRVLGPIELRVAGQSIHLARRQQRLIVGILALEANRVVTCDRLIDLLWEDRPPSRARGVIHSRISELRGAFTHVLDDRSGRLRADGTGYVLEIEPDLVDAHRFRRLLAKARGRSSTKEARHLLREALSLWHGSVLDGQLGPAGRSALCHDLESMRLTAAEDLFDIDLQLGHQDEIVDHVVQLATANPSRERLAGQAMLALHRMGRTAEALHHYDEWRRWLRDELGVDPGGEVQRLHVGILRNDLELAPDGTVDAGGATGLFAAGTESTGTAGSAFTGPPHELPPDTGCFVGRGPELRELQSALAPAGLVPRRRPAVAVIYGQGGVGKSALAVHVAHEIAHEFPDGQIHLDLRGMTPGMRPLTPADALRRVLGSLGLSPEDVPRDEEAAAARFRTITASLRILLVLDNADEISQVSPLVPASGTSAVIITSRRPLSALDADIRLRLEGLTEPESVSLLRRLAPGLVPEQTTAETIVRLCDHLPLAVRIAAGRLTGHPKVSPAELADRLADSRRRLDELELDGLAVRSCIRIGYDALAGSNDPTTALAARVFCAVGLLKVHDVVPATIAAMLGEPDVSAVERSFDHLTAIQLLEVDTEGRYRLHDLVRLVAHEQAMVRDTPAERKVALSRAADYYLARLRAAAGHLWPGRAIANARLGTISKSSEFPGPTEASIWIDTETTNLLAIADQAGEVEPDGWRVTVQIADLLALRLHRQVEWHGGRRLAARALDLAEQHAPDELVGWAHLMLGRFEAELGDPTSAKRHFEQARTIFLGFETPVGVGHTLLASAVVAGYMNDVEGTIRLSHECLTVARKQRLPTLEAAALNNLGMLCGTLHRWTDALEYFGKCVAIRRQLSDWDGVGSALSSVAAIRCLTDQLDEAWLAINEALACAQKAGDRHLQCNALLIGTEANLRIGQYREAMTGANAVLSLARSWRNAYAEAFALRQLAKAKSAAGESDESKHLDDEAAGVFARLSRRPDPILEILFAETPAA